MNTETIQLSQASKFLLRAGAVTEQQALQAEGYRQDNRVILPEAYRACGLLEPVDYAKALAQVTAFGYHDLAEYPINPLQNQLPLTYVEQFRAMIIDTVSISSANNVEAPLREAPDFQQVAVIQVVLEDWVSRAALEDIQLTSSKKMQFFLADYHLVRRAIEKHIARERDNLENRDNTLLQTARGFIAGGDDEAIVRQVNDIIMGSVKARASDIHIEPMIDNVRIRLRIDGRCYDREYLAKRYQNALISRFKLLAGMDITERRIPQDGRMRLEIANKLIDFRVSSVPTKFGESIVLRILDKSALTTNVLELGLTGKNAERVAKILAAPDGVVLLTGPTGSGKTTTLYSFLAEVKTPETKVITTEDPVEYSIEGVTQVQVNETVGLDFGVALRAILRHDPDIVLIGEVRDRETADIAVRAAMTGHKVFSTLHTNDAPSAMTRLIDLGVDPFLITSSIQAVIAQRLVRKLCPRCKKATELNDHEQALLNPSATIGITAGIEETYTVTKTVFSPVGCRLCGSTGYYGRLPIFEILWCDETVRRAVLAGESSDQLRQVALNTGMKSLLEDGLDKVRAGLTTLHDIVNVVG